MSNLNLDGFVTPEQSFGGLYNVSNKLQENRLRSQQEQQRNDANKASMSKFLTDYADPKAHLSGSPTDPLVTQGFSKILEEGMDLINKNKGLTNDMLIMALSPKVSKLATYASKAKVIKGQIDEGLKNINENSGYIKSKLSEEARRSAFYNEDGTLKEDFDAIDDSKNWIGETIMNKPDLVTNNKGLDEWIKGNKMMANSNEITEWNNRGGKVKRKVKTTAYDWAVPEVDEKTGTHTRGFVPLYDKAIDGDEEIIGEFDDGKGGIVKAPVRLLDEGLFKSILANSDGTADWVRGQVMKAIKDGKHTDKNGNLISLNSPQANNLGRMILYDELKKRGLGGMENEVENKPTQIKVFAPRSGGGSGGSQKSQEQAETENNLHKTLDDIAPDDNGRLDVSTLLNGIKFVNKYNDQVVINSGKYDPVKKDFVIQTDKGEEVIPYHKLVTLAENSNSGREIKWMKGFKTYSRSGNANNKKEEKEEKLGFVDGFIQNVLGLKYLKNKGKGQVKQKPKKDSDPAGLGIE